MKMKTSFTDYLKKEELTSKSIASTEAAVKLFLKWLVKQSIGAEQCRYTDILAYMKHCQQRELTQSTVQNYLWMIRRYYGHLISEGQIKTNPVSGIKVQGVKRKTLYHIFQPQELNALYNSQGENTLPEKKHKVMLGLLVYQGLSAASLAGLEITDIKLKAGQVEIRGSRTSNARTLQLEPSQYLTMHEYLTVTRGEILAQSKEQTTKLIIGQHGGSHFSNLIQDLLRPLKKQHKNLKNAKQLRASVIVKWLRQYNLREVQYLAGHRYISSTESYQQSEMEGLTEEVHKFHPLG